MGHHEATTHARAILESGASQGASTAPSFSQSPPSQITSNHVVPNQNISPALTQLSEPQQTTYHVSCCWHYSRLFYGEHQSRHGVQAASLASEILSPTGAPFCRNAFTGMALCCR